MKDPPEEDEEEEEYKWWQDENLVVAKKGERRWETLEHNGVLFPPAYVPHGIPIKYSGAIFTMTPEEEEVATMFAAMRETDYYKNEVFRRNFFAAWRNILDRREHPIRNLGLCDFDAIWDWFCRQREARLSMSREEKKRLKDETAKLTEPYKYCKWDGRKEQVSNYKVEVPGLFRGRGKHPLQGSLKRRVQPEDITINIGEDAPVPKCADGHRWAAVVHDHNVTWLATWCDSVTGNEKYVMLHAASTIKGMTDREKFEKARHLKERVVDIRASYMKDWASQDAMVRQRAVAMYFIDRLALRVGNEKGEDEADTVGCCSLRVEHVECKEDGKTLHFDFLGKDSVPYKNDVEVDPTVFRLVKEFKRGKQKGEEIFDLLTTRSLNEHLNSFMEGLTAKVFRTYNASHCLDEELKKNPVSPKLLAPEKLVYFTKANTKVALLCNHQKAVGRSFDVTMKRLEGRQAYLTGLLERLQQAKKDVSAEGAEKAKEIFLKVENEIQYQWLKQYGTPEELEKFQQEQTNNNKTPRPQRAKVKTPKPCSQPDDDDVLIGVLASRKQAPKRPREEKSAPQRKTPKAQQDKEDLDDDLPISALL